MERDTKTELTYTKTNENNTTEEVSYSYGGTAMYQSVVEASGKKIPGYTLYREEQNEDDENGTSGGDSVVDETSVKKTVKISNDPKQNVITFEYYALRSISSTTLCCQIPL